VCLATELPYTASINEIKSYKAITEEVKKTKKKLVEAMDYESKMREEQWKCKMDYEMNKLEMGQAYADRWDALVKANRIADEAKGMVNIAAKQYDAALEEKEHINVSLEDYERAIEENLTTPLTGEGDVGKLKELTKRFPYGDFNVTNETTGITYQVVYDSTSPEWCPAARWYHNSLGLITSSQHNFPRPCKIVITTTTGFKRNVTHLFD
jgi:hypothetical protein